MWPSCAAGMRREVWKREPARSAGGNLSWYTVVAEAYAEFQATRQKMPHVDSATRLPAHGSALGSQGVRHGERQASSEARSPHV